MDRESEQIKWKEGEGLSVLRGSARTGNTGNTSTITFHLRKVPMKEPAISDRVHDHCAVKLSHDCTTSHRQVV